ncbi:hypothetical protein GCM10009639_35200 [Kitasatospora putterlickiae]|uniref:TIGR04222 domain-containing membrane protein n=1 Tax=Kitasatospora putterlickiae TaxID=221725 RepID=A0ABN1Y4B8_9ACTN
MWLVVVLLLGAAVWPARAGLRCRAARGALRRAERSAAGREPDLEPYELAVLAKNVPELFMARMYADGRLVASRSGDVTITRANETTGGSGAPGEGDFETAVVRALGSRSTWGFRLLAWTVAQGPGSRALLERLVAMGLLEDEVLRRRAEKACLRMAWASATIAPVGLVALVWTLARNEDWRVPVVSFTVLLAAALGVRVASLPGWRYATGTGARLLAEARADDRWKHGTAAVAAHGLAALPEDHDLRICREGDDRRTAALLREERSRAPAPPPARDGGVGACGMGCGGGCGGGV